MQVGADDLAGCGKSWQGPHTGRTNGQNPVQKAQLWRNGHSCAEPAFNGDALLKPAELAAAALERGLREGRSWAVAQWHKLPAAINATEPAADWLREILLPSHLGEKVVPNWDFALHLQEVEYEFLRLCGGEFRRLMLSIPIRHGKSQYANLAIAWLLLRDPTLRILRVMAASDTAEMQALQALQIIEKFGPILGVKIDQKKHGAGHFKTTAGGELRSIGASGDVESWTFDWIFIDDILSDPYEIRNPNRRQQVYQDLQTKFFSHVNPLGNTKFVFIGSRRHPDDPQGRLLEADKRDMPEAEKWHYHMRPAILNEDTEEEIALWPTSVEFDLDGLHKIKAQKGTGRCAMGVAM